MKLKFSLLLAAALPVMISSTIVSAKTYTQKGYGLTSYYARDLKLVNNHNYFVTQRGSYAYSPNYQKLATFQTKKVTYKSTGGNQKAQLTTAMFLPVSYKASGDLGNPQSIALTPNGAEAYVMYTKAGGANTGFVVHYNLSSLRQALKASNNLAVIRQATNALRQGQASTAYKTILKNIHVGPKFNTGHGQSLALNPKTNQLWFVQNPGSAGAYATIKQLSKKTLKPCNTIRYRLVSKRNNRVTMGSNLTFDNRGRAYFSSYVAGTNQLKIYQGVLSTRQTKFKLIHQGLAHRPGTKNQSIGYNPANNRLYFISDDAFSSVPVSKLGHLKPKDVLATTFKSHREFEALSFTNSGNAYLLSNKGAELMAVKFK